MCNQEWVLNSPWKSLKLLPTIPLNYELKCFSSSLDWTQVWAHKQYQACMDMNNNNNARYKERVERERFKPKYKDIFRDLSHCSTSPPSHRIIFTMSTKDLPQRDLHRGITTYQPRVYNSNSLTQLYTRG